MGKKPKARRDKSEDRGEAKEKTQGERFIETARALGVDETGTKFEGALSKILHTRIKNR